MEYLINMPLNCQSVDGPDIQRVVDCIQPDFIVNELAHHTHDEWGQRISRQMTALGVLT